MRREIGSLGRVAGVVALALIAVGCDKFSGGGWLTSSTGEGKATFALHGKCETVDDPVSGPSASLHEGRLQYNDHGAGVRFHGDIDPLFPVPGSTCEELVELLHLGGFADVFFVGTYRPQPKGAPGDFSGDIVDGGEGGLKGDIFCISVHSGEYSGYQNCGPLQGGNIQVK